MDIQEQNRQFQALIAPHKGILHKVARTYCPDEEDRQDLLQEMMIQIWRALPGYNSAYKASTWLYRIALNVAISFYRKQRTRKTHSSPLSDAAPTVQETDKSEQQEQLALLEQFISELKELDKALILLYLEEKPQAEIAEILGISVSNVATKVGRIKARLKVKFSLINT
ncbi:MAG: sigma-70 family RNA polymerase sigma factor [Bacteroidetes bacterium]|nr:MAG: sigma-70 family RNA polymerase sigma factor [Bacteroidota bacterium]